MVGDQFDVKVEITPPQPSDGGINMLPKSISNESAAAFSMSINEFQAKASTPSPQQRKFSEIQEYTGLLSAMGSITRMNPSPTGSNASSRFFKKIEEMIDLSSPYNHYKCLSPSETNLTQFADTRIHAFSQLQQPQQRVADINKPGSGRLLRRQFSLDKGKYTSVSERGGSSRFKSKNQKYLIDDQQYVALDDAAALQQSYRLRQEQRVAQQLSESQSMEVTSPSSGPGGSTTGSVGVGGGCGTGNKPQLTKSCSQQCRIPKQHSISTAQENLEKIEENPISPNNVNNHMDNGGGCSEIAAQPSVIENSNSTNHSNPVIDCESPQQQAVVPPPPPPQHELRLNVETLTLR